MKKIKFFAAAAMFCTAAFAGYTAYDKATMTDEEKMFQANLEALTNDEGEQNGVLYYRGDNYYCCRLDDSAAHCGSASCPSWANYGD